MVVAISQFCYLSVQLIYVVLYFVADHINNDKQNLRIREYKLVFVPRKVSLNLFL